MKQRNWERGRDPPPPPHMLEGRTRTSLPASLCGTADSASLGDAVLPSQNKHALQYCWLYPTIWSSSGNYFPAFPVVLMTLPRVSVFITCCRTDIQEKKFLVQSLHHRGFVHSSMQVLNIVKYKILFLVKRSLQTWLWWFLKYLEQLNTTLLTLWLFVWNHQLNLSCSALCNST